MAAKKKNSIINYFLIGVLVVCFVMIMFELSSNTLDGLQPDSAGHIYVVNSDELPVYETMVSDPEQISGTPTPTSDDVMDQYYDTGE